MATSKLALFNDALLYLDERKLASLAESRESRRALDDAYDDALSYCLEQGMWNIGMRTIEKTSTPSIEPAFGYEFGFQKPDDWIRTIDVSPSPTMQPPLTYFNDEAGVWYADVDPLYIRYISDDENYGGDLSRWPATFSDYVAIRLAMRTCGRITGNSSKMDGLLKLERKARIDARSKDAMNEGVKFPPTGTWARSRGNGLMRSRWDRQS